MRDWARIYATYENPSPVYRINTVAGPSKYEKSVSKDPPANYQAEDGYCEVEYLIHRNLVLYVSLQQSLRVSERHDHAQKVEWLNRADQSWPSAGASCSSGGNHPL